MTPEFKKLRGEMCLITAKALLDRSPDRVVLLGPLVWFPSDGTAAKVWRFFVNVGNRETGSVRIGNFGEDTKEMARELRDAMSETFQALRPLVQVIDFGDELQMAWEAAQRWPSEYSQKLLDGVFRARAGDERRNSR